MPDTSALIGVEARFKALPVEDCFESPTNPRTHRNPSKYAELLASVRAGGVHTPVISRPAPMLVAVSPNGKKTKSVPGWEVIAGSGRLRAAKEAGRLEIPSMVAEYTDQQVLEIQLIENLIREDPHPLQESEGFRRLLELPGYTIELVMERTGARRDHISKRLSLCNLIQAAKDSFLADAINIGHATRLARLPEPQQKFAFNELLFTQDRAWNSRANRHDVSEVYAITVQEFDRAIRSNILLDLGAAPWDKTDAELMPEAGACTTCLKHTQAQADLFDDHAKGDLCLDRGCFNSKKAALLVQIQTKARDAGEGLVLISESWNTDHKGALSKSQYNDLTRDKPAKCPHSEKALIVEGERAGMVIKICKTPECKVHRKRESHYGSSMPKKDYWAERAKALEKKINWETRIAQVSAICAAPTKWTVPHAALQVIARAMLGHTVPVELLRCIGITDKVNGTSEAYQQFKRMIAAPAVAAPATATLQQIVVALSLQETVKEYYFDGRESANLTEALKAFKVDGKKIATKVAGRLRADFNAKRAKAKAKKKADTRPGNGTRRKAVK